MGTGSNTKSPGLVYFRTKRRLHPSSHLATTNVGQKLGAPLPFGGGELGPHLTQCGQGRGLPACRLATVQQCHRQRQTDRTDRQWSDSTGRTILQTVAQKASLEVPQSILATFLADCKFAPGCYLFTVSSSGLIFSHGAATSFQLSPVHFHFSINQLHP